MIQNSDIQLWGGIECTINRTEQGYFDQHVWSGHRERLREDLEKIAELGIRTLRTALSWEYFEAQGGSWAYFDRLVDEMQRLGIEPIVGLLHHGSGPLGTDLLDPEFPEKLAAYARKVAERYPSLRRYTPVNEPHTTARFSCLYGHWYPHERSIRAYLRALVNEVKGTALAMQAIREVQPEAELVYTEDGGTIFAAPELERFRVEREHRRWLGTDLLCGRVTPEHALWGFLRDEGFSAEEIGWFAESPVPPGVLGFNYYLTSDRYLDDRMELYPEFMRGGDSGSEPLVDIEALRVRPEGLVGVASVLREAWERYGVPVAVTEVHLCGHSDDQIRWLAEVWESACAARDSGADVRAVTMWALLGSWNWTNLCTWDEGVYEPGVFQLVDGKLEPTPLAAAVRQLAVGEGLRHPALRRAGWWTEDSRLLYGVEEMAAG